MKDDEAHGQAKGIAAEGSSRGQPRTAAALRALGQDCAALMTPDEHSSDHADLYGADGLPA